MPALLDLLDDDLAVGHVPTLLFMPYRSRYMRADTRPDGFAPFGPHLPKRIMH
jgi:hypothetical protein